MEDSFSEIDVSINWNAYYINNSLNNNLVNNRYDVRNSLFNVTALKRVKNEHCSRNTEPVFTCSAQCQFISELTFNFFFQFLQLDQIDPPNRSEQRIEEMVSNINFCYLASTSLAVFCPSQTPHQNFYKYISWGPTPNKPALGTGCSTI